MEGLQQRSLAAVHLPSTNSYERYPPGWL